MGCDIFIDAYRIDERGAVSKLSSSKYFDWRDYDMYAFLADVMNRVGVPPIVEPRGWPDWLPPRKPFDPYTDDVYGNWYGGWLTIAELLEFDYSKTLASGETYRELLGEGFFNKLERMRADGVTHIVMWFS